MSGEGKVFAVTFIDRCAMLQRRPAERKRVMCVSVFQHTVGMDMSDDSRYASRTLQLSSFGRGARREVVTGNFIPLQFERLVTVFGSDRHSVCGNIMHEERGLVHQ